MPAGSVWFLETNANKIGRYAPSGQITENAIPTPKSGLGALALAPIGSVWFTESKANKLGHLAPDGSVSEIAL